MKITILKPYEMAKELEISCQTLNKYIKRDPDFPIVRPGIGIRRFVKEKVFEYMESKKKEDCIPQPKASGIILEVKGIYD